MISRFDTSLLREAIRRIKRGGGKGSPRQTGYCKHCGQNEMFRHNEVVEVLEAIADHADGIH